MDNAEEALPTCPQPQQQQTAPQNQLKSPTRLRDEAQYIAPFQPNIGPNLQSCASPGLYFSVTTDQDISAALVNLFKTAVATAPRLTQ
jgi:hypothetical protein